MKNLLLTVLLLSSASLLSQNVGIGTSTPDASAKLHVQSTNTGVLIPNVVLTDVTIAAPVTTPATGLLVWNTSATTTGGSGVGYYYWDAAKWVRLLNSSDATGEFRSIGGIVQNTTDLVNDDFVFGSPTLDYSGNAFRMFFDKSKGAFRAGYTNTTNWNAAQVGNYSVGFGYNTRATGIASVAMGRNTTANSNYATALGFGTSASNITSIAMGYRTTASGNTSTAMGSYTTASGSTSTAIGYNTNASGNSSIAMGAGTTASGGNSTAVGFYTNAAGFYSTAMGYYTTAPGGNSTAMGNYTRASGANSTAMGNYVSTGGRYGSFIIGDRSTTVTTNSSATNQMMMRFDGGYRLYSNAALTAGVRVNPGGGSWGFVSDSTKKENFISLNRKDVLDKIASFNIPAWNYKSQDKTVRHVGPMAQDFHAAFGLGMDNTTIISSDIDGINMLAIQALIEKNEALEEEVNQLKELLNNIATRLNELDQNSNQSSTIKED